MSPAESETSTVPLVAADSALTADRLGRGEQASFFAELLAHRRVETPVCLGVFGPAGSGKSLFVNQILHAVGELTAAADQVQASPFLPGILTVRIDAAADANPDELLVRGVFEALADAYPQLATDTLHAGADPLRAARDAGEALNEARRRLDAERQSLDALTGREARLTESVLFEAAGSRVDAYARRNRARIERALRLFGFNGADPVSTYKDLVREAAEADGPLTRLGLAVRTLWAYQGQTRLIVWAVIFGLIAWGASAARDNQDVWLSQIRDMGERASPVADWAQAHAHWLGPIHTAALVLAILCLAWTVLRAARFMLPIFKGVALLRLDVEGKRRDLNGLLAHQTRHVDGLAAEVEVRAEQAADAERRAVALKGGGLRPVKPAPGRDAGARHEDPPAPAFFASLGRALEAASQRPDTQDRAAPQRIVVALDGLDQLADDAAAKVLKVVRRLLGAGFVTVVAGDRSALAAGFAEADAALAGIHLNRCVQLGYNLGLSADDDDAMTGFARRLLDGRQDAAAAIATLDPGRSLFDAGWRPREAETVAALAPFAGEDPRAVKRYVNLYRVARADPHLRDAPAQVFTALALALALDRQGFPEDLAALRTPDRDAPRDLTLLRKALAAAQAASGEPVELVQAQRGFDIARHYSMRA